jgi:hypothetical protein
MTSKKKQELIDRLEADRFVLKKQYDKWFEERMEMLQRGEFEGKKEGNGYTKEENSLYKQLKKIRMKLVELNPEKYHYGGGKSKNPLYKNKAISKGDNGFYSCACCHRLFGYNESLKKLEEFKKVGGGRKKKDREIQYREAFIDCRFHAGLKPVGTIKLTTEGLW